MSIKIALPGPPTETDSLTVNNNLTVDGYQIDPSNASVGDALIYDGVKFSASVAAGVTSLAGSQGITVSGATGNVTVGSAAGGDATGTVNNLTVVALQNRSVATTAPTDGYALVWSQTNNRWQPGQVAVSAMQYVRFEANGFYIVDTAVDGVFKSAEAKTLTSILLYRGTAGSSGSTQVDVLVNGTSVFTSPSNRPSVLASSGNNAQATVSPDVPAISVNDVITMNITTTEDGDPQNVTVELVLN